MLPVQLALRISVCSTSVTDTGCSITSTATVSTTGATGCCTFRAAFFTGARLALAAAFACAALRALPRLAEFALRSFARFCTFDPFLRLAVIPPGLIVCVRSYSQDLADQMTNGSPRNLSNEFSNQLERNRARWCLCSVFYITPP
jgi:hypothetical protein